MWIGTSSGLNRYDGHTFKVYKHSSDTTAISDNNILNIFDGPHGKLWMLTLSGYNIYNSTEDRFEHDPDKQLSSMHIPDSHIEDIKKDHSGNFWFVHSSYGIYKYQPASGKTFHLQHKENESKSLYSDKITGIAESPDGCIWVAYTNGILDKIDEKSNVFG